MLINKRESETVLWGIWKIEESTETLLSLLVDTVELLEFKKHTRSESRIRERVATRVLLKELLGEEVQINYTPSGKPSLRNKNIHLSISHTRGYAAVALSMYTVLGIDIEYISNRVKRVESMFINEDESIDTSNEIQHLLLHWSAKESMYKALNKDGIDFKADFTIEKFTPYNEGTFKASENYSGLKQKFSIQYYIENEYVLTLASPEL